MFCSAAKAIKSRVGTMDFRLERFKGVIEGLKFRFSKVFATARFYRTKRDFKAFRSGESLSFCVPTRSLEALVYDKFYSRHTARGCGGIADNSAAIRAAQYEKAQERHFRSFGFFELLSIARMSGRVIL